MDSLTAGDATVTLIGLSGDIREIIQGWDDPIGTTDNRVVSLSERLARTLEELAIARAGVEGGVNSRDFLAAQVQRSITAMQNLQSYCASL